MKTQIISLRVRIDGLAQLVESLYSDKEVSESQTFKQRYWFHELQKCHDSLRMSKAWLGKILAALGEESPYQNSGNRKTIEDIEPAVDKAILKPTTEERPMTIDTGNGDESIQSCFANKTHIEKKDWLREEIKNLEKEFNSLSLGAVIDSSMYSNLISFYTVAVVQQHLIEARFWLGYELERIKNS